MSAFDGIFPGYVLHGRTYKTVRGLTRAIFTTLDADGHSMIGNDRVLRVYRGKATIAEYVASAPALGKPVTLTLREGVPA